MQAVNAQAVSEQPGWQQEWTLLQSQYEAQELLAQKLKVLTVISSGLGLLFAPALLVAMLLIAVLWLQEAIVRTQQNRLGARLLVVESALRSAAAVTADRPMQLHSQWLAQRGGGGRLVREYAGQALRPTVLIPHALLLLVLVLKLGWSLWQ